MIEINRSSNVISLPTPWWSNGGGFFGSKYIEGDDSVEGYLPGKVERLKERTEREVDGIIKLLHLKKEEKILDVPCGYGRHTIELLFRGYSAMGLDINQTHISEAEKRLHLRYKGTNQNTPFKPATYQYFGIGDMRKVVSRKSLIESCNAIINMFYSFGFFEDEKDNEKVMEEFFKTLKSNGQLLIHSDVSPEIISSGKYRFDETRSLTSGKKLHIREEYNPQTKRINGTWTIIGENKHQEKLTPYSVRIYSVQEFEKMAKRKGFRDVRFFGSFEGEKFTKESKELIMIAKK